MVNHPILLEVLNTAPLGCNLVVTTMFLCTLIPNLYLQTHIPLITHRPRFQSCEVPRPSAEGPGSLLACLTGEHRTP